MIRSHYRGHAFHFENGKWTYSDGRIPTSVERTDCGFCGRERTGEGHDGCLGTLPKSVIMNACCGHGRADDAYIQFWNGVCIRGKKAVAMIHRLLAKED